jgi:hypothetical protein
MEVRILLIGRYFTLAGPAKPIRVARPKAVDLARIKIKNVYLRPGNMNAYLHMHFLHYSAASVYHTM